MFRNFGRCIRLGLVRKPVFQEGIQGVFCPQHSRSISSTGKLTCLTRDHIKVNLYPEEEDPILETIFEASSMQQVFDTYNSLKPEELMPKYSSQALVTLWDLQKFMFQIGRFFRMSPTKEYMNQEHYIQTLRQHETLQKIVSHIVSHCSELGDEALAASLLCIWRLKFDVRGETCQALLNELLKRKSTLDLPGLSRLCVTLKGESLYGYIVMAEFAPLLHSYILNMSTDEDVRLVSIAIRGGHAVTTKQALNEYILRVKQIIDEGTVKLEAVTLCKILMFLFERQLSYQAPLGSSSTDIEMTKITAALLRRTGNMLIPHVENMGEMDLLNISKFLEFQKEPALLIDALTDRVSRLVQESEGNPSADLLACVQPTRVEQKIQLGNYLKQNLQDCETFSRMYHLAFRMLKKCLFEKELFDRFWSLYQEMLERGPIVVGEIYLNWDDSPADDEDEDATFSTAGYGPLKFLKFVVKYMNIRVQVYRPYRHYGFETAALRRILEILRNYDDGKCVITTQDYAKCVAFLVAVGYRDIPLNPSFVQHFRVPDLILLYRGMQLSPRNCFDISTTLTHQTRRFLESRLTAMEYLGLAKVNVFSQQAFEMSPVFQECMDKTAEAPWDDVRTGSDLLNTVMISAYYTRSMFERISRFICEAGDDISLKCVTKFSEATYICGTGYFDALEVVANVIERNAERSHPLALIDAMLGLCYHGYLSKELVHKVFSLGFLDEVDKQIRAAPAGARVAIKLRDTFMQLNRAICIDMPEASVPWFHEKYCQEIAAVEGFSWTYVHHEVLEVLSDILGAHCVARNTYSPYYHLIDFLIKFDEGDNPLPVKSKEEEAEGKLAVIVHHPKDYTSGERRLKGFHKLKRRHLEILGYRVIEIDPLDWNSMRLSEKEAKNDYLQECIFNS